jgi:hypothetical protein
MTQKVRLRTWKAGTEAPNSAPYVHIPLPEGARCASFTIDVRCWHSLDQESGQGLIPRIFTSRRLVASKELQVARNGDTQGQSQQWALRIIPTTSAARTFLYSTLIWSRRRVQSPREPAAICCCFSYAESSAFIHKPRWLERSCIANSITPDARLALTPVTVVEFITRHIRPARACADLRTPDGWRLNTAIATVGRVYVQAVANTEPAIAQGQGIREGAVDGGQ